MKQIIIGTTLFFLVGCSLEEQKCAEQQVILGASSPAMKPSNNITAIVHRKRILSHNREQYYAHLSNGQEIMFIVDAPLHYEIGDKVNIPNG